MGKLGTSAKAAATLAGVGIAVGLLALGSHAVLSANQPQTANLPRAAADASTSPGPTDVASPNPTDSPSPSPFVNPTPVEPVLPPAAAVASPTAVPVAPVFYCGYAYQAGPFPLERAAATPVYGSCEAALAGGPAEGTWQNQSSPLGFIRTPKGKIFLLPSGKWSF